MPDLSRRDFNQLLLALGAKASGSTKAGAVIGTMSAPAEAAAIATSSMTPLRSFAAEEILLDAYQFALSLDFAGLDKKVHPTKDVTEIVRRLDAAYILNSTIERFKVFRNHDAPSLIHALHLPDQSSSEWYDSLISKITDSVSSHPGLNENPSQWIEQITCDLLKNVAEGLRDPSILQQVAGRIYPDVMHTIPKEAWSEFPDLYTKLSQEVTRLQPEKKWCMDVFQELKTLVAYTAHDETSLWRQSFGKNSAIGTLSYEISEQLRNAGYTNFHPEVYTLKNRQDAQSLFSNLDKLRGHLSQFQSIAAPTPNQALFQETYTFLKSDDYQRLKDLCLTQRITEPETQGRLKPAEMDRHPKA